MRKQIFLLALLFLSTSALALTVTVDKKIVEKGQSVLFSGSCSPNKAIFVKATQDTRFIFEAGFQCPETAKWSVP